MKFASEARLSQYIGPFGNTEQTCMIMYFSKNSHCDLDLSPRTLKLKFIQDIVILNICMKQNQNRLRNKGARVMTKFF